MSERKRDFLIGATAILGLIGLGLMLFLFGELRPRDTYTLHLRLNTAAGLYKASPVTLNGVRIGRVTKIAPAIDPLKGADLSLEITDSVRVPKSIEVAIERSLVGDASLALRPRQPDSPQAALEFYKPGDQITATAGGAFDEIARMIDSRLGSLQTAADNFNELASTWTRVGERAHSLLTPRTPEEVDAGAGEPTIGSTIARIDRAAAALDSWAGDKALQADAKRAFARAADLFDQASEAVQAWTDTARAVSTRADQIGDNVALASRDFAALAKSLGETVEEVRALAASANAGQGTLGQLVRNPDLYNSLTDAAKRLEKALLEAQLLIEKYRREGVPIRF